jgi:O-antigen ligase
METEAGAVFPAGLDIGQLAFLTAVGVWLIRKAADRASLWGPAQRSAVPLYLALLIFLAAALVSLPGAYSLSQGLSESLKWLEILALVVIAADLGVRRRDWLVFGLLLAAVIQAVLGVYQFYGGSGAPHLWILDYRYFRAFGAFGQPNPFGAFMGLSLPLALGATYGYGLAAWQARRTLTVWQPYLALAGVYGTMALIILAGLVVSWSRGAWMGFGAAALALIWLAPGNLKQGTLALAGVGLLVAALGSAGWLPASATQRIAGFTEDFSGFGDMRGAVINDENFPVVERLAHWQAAVGMATRHPWLGVGFGNYAAAYPNFALINWPLALGHAHNYYLNLLAETGVVGLTAYIIMGAGVIRLTYQRIRCAPSPVERGLALGLMGVWTHLAVHSLFDKLYVNNLFLTVGVLVGLLAILLHQTAYQEKVHESVISS